MDNENRDLTAVHPQMKKVVSLESFVFIALFIGFFGFYPILKSTLEKIKIRSVEYICKFAVFNACILISYWVIINVFGIGDIIEEMGDFGDYGLLVMLLIANVTFFVYDIALTRIISSYINWFRPNILRKS